MQDMIKRQIEFQKNMNSNSEEMTFALWAELGEYIDSLGVFTWKKNPRDDENAIMELVDISIFAINLAYYANRVYVPVHKLYPKTEFELVNDITSCMASKDYNNIYLTIFRYEPKVAEILTAKQALNQFRQDNGYKTGDYKKMWNGKQDNTYLEEMYGASYEAVYAKLSELYAHVHS